MTNSERTEDINDEYSSNHKTEESMKNIIDPNTSNQPTAEKKPSMKKDKTNYQNKYVEFLQNLH